MCLDRTLQEIEYERQYECQRHRTEIRPKFRNGQQLHLFQMEQEIVQGRTTLTENCTWSLWSPIGTRG